MFLWFYVEKHPKACRQFIAKAYTCNTHSHCIKNLFEKSINSYIYGFMVGSKTPRYRSKPASSGFAFAVCM